MNKQMKEQSPETALTPGMKTILTRMIRLSKDVGYTLQDFSARFHDKYHDPDAELFVRLNWHSV